MRKALRWADSIRNSCRSPLGYLIHPLSLKETAQSLCPQPMHIAHYLQMGPRRQHQGLLVPLSEWQLTLRGPTCVTVGAKGHWLLEHTALKLREQSPRVARHSKWRPTVSCWQTQPSKTLTQCLSDVFRSFSCFLHKYNRLSSTFLIFLTDVSLVAPWVLSNTLLNFTLGGILLSLFDLLAGLLRWGSTLESKLVWNSLYSSETALNSQEPSCLSLHPKCCHHICEPPHLALFEFFKRGKSIAL